MQDLIDRQEVIDTFNVELSRDENGTKREYIVGFKGAKKIIERVPSVQPEQRWILCSKTVDIPDHEIMACDRYGSLMFGYLAYADDQWLCESDSEMMYDPIAWSEKPEPYREDGGE